ncbi:uroporphyrinogen-III C-methyltransferase [Desmospora profundinema]|uniref:uroporphyrinogen-III C-methyltransferase n=1 Tax=Desmospora profundinema TaxID=1571184 RepID=A0ABU1IPN6_9BACL|nr:uroporphyrinogen-III C-methyltransferase [Desmospora profundinema]MDR6226740.1 uroporphyrin-III C-methyltransferase [Desmospora profundinema]
MNDCGKVYLVGAGPGDPSLITVRGMELLQRADVIVYDRLVHPDLLRYARPSASLVYCGKRPGHHTLPQEEINRILVKQATAGKQVVRLKGGDPGMFARVGEEAAHCARHAIPYEIVPGVTAGLAAPLYAGIPLTHRGTASSVAFVTGHGCGGEEPPSWGGLAEQVDTLVIYMGMSNLPQIRQSLLHHGRSPDTPVALIRWGTWKGRQETLSGTLGNIEEKVRQQKFASPAIIVVGEVVAYQKHLAWFEGGGSDTLNKEDDLEQGVMG